MKKAIPGFLLLISSLFLYSQEKQYALGFSGGMTFSNVKAIDYLPGNYIYRSGLAGELNFQMNFSSHFFIRSDLGILQRGYNFEHESLVSFGDILIEKSYSGIELKIDHYYLNHGLSIGYQYGNNLSVSISGGFYYSYYLVSKFYDHNYLYIDPIEHDLIDDPAVPAGYFENESSKTERSQSISNWDLGVIGCLSFGYKIKPKTSIRLTWKYHHGMHDIYISEMMEQAKVYNRSFALLIGLEFRI